MRADDNDELHAILRDFLEPDTNDKKIHGGAVIRTVNLFFLKIFMLFFSLVGMIAYPKKKKNQNKRKQDEPRQRKKKSIES